MHHCTTCGHQVRLSGVAVMLRETLMPVNDKLYHRSPFEKWCKKYLFEMLFAPKHQKFSAQNTFRIQN